MRFSALPFSGLEVGAEMSFMGGICFEVGGYLVVVGVRSCRISEAKIKRSMFLVLPPGFSK